ncbi:MAG TPA: hypothetical protein VF655_00160 [Allosphingosinicella sp.]|jgi:hypothetical protein
MAKLRIWESVRGASGLPLVRLDDRVNYQEVTFSGAAAASAAFDADTSVISVLADVACAVKVSSDPTADINSFPVPANTRIDFEVTPGSKISAIAA